MSRFGPVAFAALAAATVGAFFVTQHLKIADPLYNGQPKPDPAVIAPLENGCGGAFRVARLSFYLQLRSDDVAVSIVDAGGEIVRTLTRSRHMVRGIRSSFPWNGRTDSGRVAPDGTYYWRVVLLGQGRTLELPKPVTVRDTPPGPRVTSVAPQLLPAPHGALIRFAGTEGREVAIQLYRVEGLGRPRLVETFRAIGDGRARWNGRIGGRPAPAGTYLVGLTVTDRACNTGRFPATLPPSPGTAAHAEVTVRPNP